MEENKKEWSNDRAKRMMLWMGVASIAMFFAAFTSAYVVLQADHFWVKDQLPNMLFYSTIIILLSSVTIFLAKRSIEAGNSSAMKSWLVITLMLGLGFSAVQYLGWSEMRSEGKYFRSNISDLTGEYGTDYVILMKGEPLLFDQGNFYKPGDINFLEPINERINDTFNVSASLLYILSGLHMLHLLGGILWLIVLLVKSFSGAITQQNLLPLELGSIYWHFLDILWIYLFVFLLLIR